MSLEELNNPIYRLADALEEHLVRIEIPALVVIIAGVILAALEIDTMHLVFIAGMGFAALTYFIVGFSVYSQEGTAMPVGYRNFLNKLTYWGFSIALTGMLLYIMEWPAATIMLVIASALLIIDLVLSTVAIQKHEAGDEYDQAFWMRFMIITGLCCYTVYKIFLPAVLSFIN